MPMFQNPMQRPYGVVGPSAAPQAAPQSGGLFSKLDQFRTANPGVLAQFGSALMSRSPAAPGFAQAAQMMQVNKVKNDTAQYLLDKGLADSPEEAMTLASNETLMKTLFKDNLIQDQAAARKAVLESMHLNPDDPKYLDYRLSGQFAADGGAGRPETWSVTPTYGKDATGKTVLGTTSDRGNFRTLETGSFDPYSPYDKSFDRSSGAAAGKIEGDAIGNLDSMNANMPGLEATVKQLETLSDQATYTPGGQLIDAGMRWADMEPRDGAVARTKYMAIVDNQVLPLLRETFGAQFTVTEGESLRATLGAPDKTPAEKKAVLASFIEQKRRNIQALAAQTGQTIPAPGGGGGWTVERQP